MEIVSFKANPQYAKDQVQEALLRLNDVLKLQEGFIDRITANDDNGVYIDLVYWTNVEAAKKAAENVSENPDFIATFEFIRPETIQIQHLEVFNEFEEYV